MTIPTISSLTARRYILGKQGLWPGRRWIGQAGVAQALKEIEAIQIDPLNVVGRSHDLALHSRVIDYQPQQFENVLYNDRLGFDWGGALFVYPMAELPYWRAVMKRLKDHPQWGIFPQGQRALINEVKRELRQRGPLGNRDFDGRRRVDHYRASKDSGLALYYLWRSGELMTHSRRGNFERVFGFRDHIAPPEMNRVASIKETEQFFARKTIAFYGLMTARSWRLGFANKIDRTVTLAEAQRRLDRAIKSKEFSLVNVEGWKEPAYLLAEDQDLLLDLETGQIPDRWRPIDTTTDEEILFLAPLEIVSARGRAKTLFDDYEYIWEVYKPEPQRRWGYYTLPILYGDRLVARIDPRHAKASNTLVINGLWLDDRLLAKDATFMQALLRGISRLLKYLNTEAIDLSPLQAKVKGKSDLEAQWIRSVVKRLS
ncbi:MAG TPA: crosslink repair DNA glycosylase YcaQ family protein [Anaerolineae bacterium]|nr:crosslink repair DNA glycosylase YcaQ family protein [Anaerolineae bacterium]